MILVSRPLGKRGSVLIEGALSLMITLLAITANLELIRRVSVEVALHLGAFYSARENGLRQRGNRLGKREAKLASSGLIDSGVIADTRLKRDGVQSRWYLRYPSLMSFPLSDSARKHHFEVTHRCFFPY